MKKIFFLLLLLLPALALACPGCNDDFSTLKTGVKPLPYTFIILGIFVLLTYIPLFILFRAAKKFDASKLDGNS